MLKPFKLTYHSLLLIFMIIVCSNASAVNTDIKQIIANDYNNYLNELFLHFHKTPELSLQEFKTAKRMAEELRKEGFTVTENVGVL